MSDDFDDDSFLVDDSFLREVDTLTASAAQSSVGAGAFRKNAGPSRTTSLPSSNLPKETLPARSISTILPSFNRPTFANKPNNGPKSTFPPVAAPSRYNQPGPSHKQAQLPFKPSTTAQPPSDDFDDISLPLESLAAFDQITKQQPKPPGIPSSRLKRTTSSGGLQLHLNYRRENQSTKGKRWDRTAYAETGRRASGKGKGKAKGKGQAGRSWEDDEAGESEEDDWGEPLAPNPKPLVDPSTPYGPQKHCPNPATIKTYIYPTNRPKRDYQYEIVQACFTDNCLVALPTGLGKTFVAGVVMLNFYRWFPTGKIVFLAPTRPLVNQQIEACQTTCGIPSRDAAVMTGESVSAKERVKLWEDRRVFYCTPQTLENDLKKGSVDPKDIVLAVFDEAHKASGGYAYTTILAYITAHHPHFRVLALTATPGADVPKVQGVVDALHISRIEIREAEAADIRKYMNDKQTEKHYLPMGSVIEGFRDRWAALMKPMIVKLVQKDILRERDLDIPRLKTFSITSKRMDISRDRNSNVKWAIGNLTILEKMARGMGNLLEFSIGMFHNSLLEISGNVNSSNGKKGGSNGAAGSIRNNYEFQKLLRDVEAEMNCIRIGKGGKTKADRHPKMAKTLELLVDHFTQAAEDEKERGVKNDTRAMVFCSYRNPVLEIVEMLNDHSGLLRATKFVGQAAGKTEGDTGFNQKEQKKTINDFKEGKFNILVSTSIGEEGLDIGEVDFVIIYDMPKQSIKLLQRVGRTGRKRDGKVHVLMSEGREDANWEKAQATHREIQEEILHSRNLELFEDVERLISPGPLPTCIEQFMDVDVWDPEDQKPKRASKAAALTGEKKAATKKTKKDKEKETSAARGHQIPDGVSDGFKSVAQLLRESGRTINGASLSATESSSPPLRIKTKGATRKRKKDISPVLSESEDGEFGEVNEVEARALEELLGPPPAKKARQSSTNKAIETKGTSRASKTDVAKKREENRKLEIDRKEQERKQLEEEAFNKSAEDFFSTLNDPSPEPDDGPPSSPMLPPWTNLKKTGDLPKMDCAKPSKGHSPPIQESATKLSPTMAAMVGFSQVAPIDLSWNGDDDEEEEEPEPVKVVVPSPIPSVPMSSHPRKRTLGLQRPRPTPPTQSTTAAIGASRSSEIMPPPPIPLHRSSPLVSKSNDSPVRMPEATQFPIRRPGRRRAVVAIGDSSSERPSPPQGIIPADMSSPLMNLGRLNRRQVVVPESPVRSSPPPAPVRRHRQRAPAAQVREYLDMDVEVSGSESSDEPDSDHENSQDRAFANDFQPTQAPRGYDQRAIYRAGLSTQAAPKHGLQFQQRVDREAFMAKARRPVYVSEDEESRSENEYELGSFVCPDDDDVGFETQSDALSCA